MSRSRNLLVLLALFVVGSSSAARGEITAEEVRDSIDSGVEYLFTQQHPNEGTWTEYQYRGDATAFNTLALLESGVPVEDERIQKALDHLRQIGDPEDVYVASLQIMVFAAAEPERDLQIIRRNANWLERAQVKEGTFNGAWGYEMGSQGGDNSNTQFAILALHEAERIGVSVDNSTWRRTMRYWIDAQHIDGAWGYSPNQRGTGSMTCAGVASLVMAAGRFSQDATVRGDQIFCCGAEGHETEDQALAEEATMAIEKGLTWLGRNFNVNGNPGFDGAFNLYYLYALERVGRMTGQRFLYGRDGVHYDWYREGADHLIALQAQDRLTHAWVGTGPGESRADLGTSMALLFLAKGRRPVMVAKLAYERQNDNWNLHRGDVAHLTAHMEKLWDQYLTWQTIDLAAASTEDLLQAPVVFLTGREALDFTDPMKANLKAYIESGGFLLAAANEGGEAFDTSFRELMEELFPYSELRLLEADHPIWFAQEAVDMDPLPELWGLDACCRTSVVYCPASHENDRLNFDLSCRWELATPRSEYPAAVERQVKAGLAIGANIMAYATGRELRVKLNVPELLRGDESADTLRRGTLRVASLDYDGGNDDAPNALPNLLGEFSEEIDMPAATPRAQITLDAEALPDFPVLFMHGRRSFRLSPLQRRQLAEYLEYGGVLFADSICANAEFAESFRREMREVLPEGRLERIPLDHPMFTSEYRGFDLPTVQLRDPHIRRPGEALQSSISQVTPFLEGIEVDGRYVVIFSPYDMSCALEAGVSQDCKGYVQEDAARLGLNILLYALQQ